MRNAPRHHALLVWPLLACLGCGDESPQGVATVSLSWSMLDGRSCPDSSVERVVVTEVGNPTLLMLDALCSTGHGASAVEFGLPAGPRDYLVEGISAQSTSLYSARLALDLSPGEERKVSVKLAFTGGR